MDKHRSARGQLRRTDLFLVRLWIEDEVSDSAIGDDGRPGWRGQVHRPVDGESHEFNNWQDLVNVLEMLWEGMGESRSDESQE